MPNLTVGAYLGWGPVFINTDKTCTSTSTDTLSCSADDAQVGIQAAFHILPKGQFDPWVGLGLGWEIFHYSTKDTYAGTTQAYSGNDNGFQFKLEGGLDFKVNQDFGSVRS
jgi:outer membrane protein W